MGDIGFRAKFQPLGQCVGRVPVGLDHLGLALGEGAAFVQRVSEAPLQAPMERLFQGPIADALTHVGQLAMLRRMAGCAFRGENYFVADIVTGRLGIEQSAP